MFVYTKTVKTFLVFSSMMWWFSVVFQPVTQLDKLWSSKYQTDFSLMKFKKSIIVIGIYISIHLHFNTSVLYNTLAFRLFRDSIQGGELYGIALLIIQAVYSRVIQWFLKTWWFRMGSILFEFCYLHIVICIYIPLFQSTKCDNWLLLSNVNNEYQCWRGNFYFGENTSTICRMMCKKYRFKSVRDLSRFHSHFYRKISQITKTSDWCSEILNCSHIWQVSQ